MTISLKIRNSTILVCITAFYALSLYAIFKMIIIPGFLSLEKREAEKNLRRSGQSIHREIEHLKTFVHDWSAWTETYEFAIEKSEAYVESNIPFSTFTDNKLNLILFSDANREIFWQMAYDLESKQQITIPELPKKRIPENSRLIQYDKEEKALSKLAVAGILMTSHGPMIIASRPILTNNNTGPPRGSVIMGRFLDKGMIRQLSRQTEVPFTADPLEIFKTENERVADAILESEEKIYIDNRNPKTLNGYTVISDISGEPILVLTAVMNREIAQKGTVTMRYSLFFAIVSGLILLVVMYVTFDRTIIRPVLKIARHSVDVGKSGDMSARLNFTRKDEIGVLAGRLDSMLSQLEKVRSELVEQSYYTGLAGISSDILHNTRNMLTPVSGRLGTIIDECTDVPADTIVKALDEFEQGEPAPERAEALMAYILLSARHFLEMSGNVKAALFDISGHLLKIERMLNELDQYSRSKNRMEPVLPDELVRFSATAVMNEFKGKIPVTVGSSIASLQPFPGEKVTLVTLFTTVLNHMIRIGEKTVVSLDIDGKVRSVHGRDFIQFTIAGRGVNVSDIALDRLFSREEGEVENRPLIGLHWCRNVISAMGGSLRAELSDNGQEALIVVLSLPLDR